MDYFKESVKKHREWQGKFETVLRIPCDTIEDLSLAYTPGVAEVCRTIASNPTEVYELTRRHNTVAVITDGTAVLGLGDIGPEAAMPVMEGKCVLFKKFANIDAIPICLNTKDPEEIIKTVNIIAKSFGGINLEDISAPRCFEIERRLKETCPVPVFHDDQHGTAIVTGAALINALKLVNKKIENIKIVINGAGSAGIAIAKFLINLGAKNIILVDRCGALYQGETYTNPAHAEIAIITNPNKEKGTLACVIKNADVFIGVSVGNIVSKEMITSMASKPVVFPLANPTPEISRANALAAGAKIVGTGASNQPNQINNLLAFPGIFRGALDTRARDINDEMQIAACLALAALVQDRLSTDYIIPSPLDSNVASTVAKAVAKAAKDSGAAGI